MNEKNKIYDDKMTKTINNLDGELATIRAGRANPHVLDKLAVDYYGTPTPIQQVANVSVPEARMIQIQPWEKKIIKDLEDELQKITDKYVAKIDKMVEAKSKEIMTV